MKKKIVLIHGNDGSDVRVGKICRSISNEGFRMFFIGWDRRPNEKKEVELGTTDRRILIYKTMHGRISIKGFFRFLLFSINQLRVIKPDVVIVVNEEMIPFFLFLRGLFYDKLVCDVFDSLHFRVRSKKLIIKFLTKFITKIALHMSDLVVFTDTRRRKMLKNIKLMRKTIVIPNTPEDPGVKLSQQYPDGLPKVFVGGTLNEGRGIKILLDAIEGLNTNVEIISCGWVYDSFTENIFLRHPKVSYLGIVSAQEALQIASRCDAIFAFYEPTTTNNILASPNKLWDAMAIGRPLIVNSEIEIAKDVQKNRMGWVCPYYDVEKLRQILNDLSIHRKDLSTFAKKARNLYKDFGSWDSHIKKLIKWIEKNA